MASVKPVRNWVIVVDDRMIPLPAQQFMSKRAGSITMEVPGNHAIYVSNARAVANLISVASPTQARQHDNFGLCHHPLSMLLAAERLFKMSPLITTIHARLMMGKMNRE